MMGRAETRRLKQRLDATFERVDSVGDNIELRSDLSRYLCVLVSGYLEAAVSELVLEHARNRGAPSLQRFVEQKTRRFTNANAQRLQELLGAFDPAWREHMEAFLVDEYKDAVDSVVSLKNQIAHGAAINVTYHRVREYYDRIQRVVDEIADLCAPL